MIFAMQVVSGMVVNLPGGEKIQLSARVGLACGKVCWGVVGLKRRLISLVGDSVAGATRMEALARPNTVLMGKVIHARLPAAMQALATRRDIDIPGEEPSYVGRKQEQNVTTQSGPTPAHLRNCQRH